MLAGSALLNINEICSSALAACDSRRQSVREASSIIGYVLTHDVTDEGVLNRITDASALALFGANFAAVVGAAAASWPVQLQASV